MAGENTTLIQFTSITVDGQAIPFEDASGVIKGAARYENEVVPGASGSDANKRKRVPTTIECKIMFTAAQSPELYSSLQGAQISAKDKETGRRVLATNCSFGKMGDIGAGTVDITFNVLDGLQWL